MLKADNFSIMISNTDVDVDTDTISAVLAVDILLVFTSTSASSLAINESVIMMDAFSVVCNCSSIIRVICDCWFDNSSGSSGKD